MGWLIFSVLSIILAMFILFYPFKVTVENKEQYLYIYFSSFFTYRINLLVLLDNEHNDLIFEQSKKYYLLKHLDFKYINIEIDGLNFDFNVGGEYYGYLHILFATLRNYAKANDIEFDYKLNYLRDKRIYFKSIFRYRWVTIIREVWRRKKLNERTSDKLSFRYIFR
ncbi:TPA: hypothetical protein GXZ34_00625 [bacterium]|nr:hypothetical protein [bacterium]